MSAAFSRRQVARAAGWLDEATIACRNYGRLASPAGAMLESSLILEHLRRACAELGISAPAPVGEPVGDAAARVVADLAARLGRPVPRMAAGGEDDAA